MYLSNQSYDPISLVQEIGLLFIQRRRPGIREILSESVLPMGDSFFEIDFRLNFCCLVLFSIYPNIVVSFARYGGNY